MTIFGKYDHSGLTDAAVAYDPSLKERMGDAKWRFSWNEDNPISVEEAVAEIHKVIDAVENGELEEITDFDDC
jgi:hypothetical protein